MKSATVVLSIFLSVSTIFAQEDGKLTKEERAEIAQYMESVWHNLEQSLEPLTPEQWLYKPADSVWSIAEIAEHLEKSEMELFSLVEEQLYNSEAVPQKATEADNKTKTIMEAITSRDQKIKTRPNLEPTGKYKTPQDFLTSFKKLREKTLDYSQQTEDALRHHFIPFGPLGDLDGYQILMFMSGHLERHRQQIEEVKATPSYPET